MACRRPDIYAYSYGYFQGKAPRAGYLRVRMFKENTFDVSSPWIFETRFAHPDGILRVWRGFMSLVADDGGSSCSGSSCPGIFPEAPRPRFVRPTPRPLCDIHHRQNVRL